MITIVMLLTVMTASDLDRLQDKWCQLRGPQAYGCEARVLDFAERFPQLVQPTDKQSKQLIQPWPSGSEPTSVLPTRQAKGEDEKLEKEYEFELRRRRGPLP
jgi:hypothetical protein